MPNYLNHYINGAWVPSEGGVVRTVINPATERQATQVTMGTQGDVNIAVAAARAAFPSFSQTDLATRAALLERVIGAYQARIPDLAYAIATEMGAPIGFASTAQVYSGLGHFAQALEAMKKFEFEGVQDGYKIVHESIGVVALITPWNWPLNQICAKVAPCLAVGNCVVLKPSEECPTVAMILAEVMHAAAVPAGVFNLVNGDGAGVGTALSQHADVDMISFTGSTRAGVLVAKAAADTVKRVHQELGGNTPNIITQGADLETIIPQALSGVIANSGQSCIAPSRILVHKSQHDAAAAIAGAVMGAVQVGDPLEQGDHIGPVVNATQFEKIQQLIKRGIDEGATLVTGGLGRPDGTSVGFYVRPTVFANVRNNMAIARQEIFGPVVTIIPYEDDADALAIANDTEYGLSAVVSGDPVRARAFTRGLRAGTVLVNNWAPSGGAPFGGYKQSGNGREFGASGLREFMEVKAIFGET